MMNPPEPGQTIRVKSLGKEAGLKDTVGSVKLLGYDGTINWNRGEKALEITCPDKIPFQSAIVFRID